MYFSPFTGALRYPVNFGTTHALCLTLSWHQLQTLTTAGNSAEKRVAKTDDRKDKVCQQTCSFLPSVGLSIFSLEKYGSIFKDDNTYLISRNAISQLDIY